MIDDDDRFDELIRLIGDARVRFWQCPLHVGGFVRWTDDVAECCSCGLKSTDRHS